MPALFTLPKQVPLTSGGELLPGAKLHFFATGTTTPQDTYQDVGLGTPHANPVEADAAGVFPPIYLDHNLPNYRVRLTDSSDVQVWQIDGYPSHQDGAQSMTLVDDNPSIILINTNASENNKKTKISSAPSGAFLISLLNDAESVQTDVFEIGRTGVTPSGTRVDDDLYSNDNLVSTSTSAIKSGDTTRTSTTTLAADPHLSALIRETGRYRIDLFLKFVGVSTGTQGLKCQLVAANGSASGLAGGGSQSVNGTTGTAAFTAGTSQFTFGTISTSENFLTHTSFVTCTPSGSMSLALHWAQNSSDANGTTLQQNSSMVITRIGSE